MAFLDLTGLSRFLDKLKTIFALDSDVVHKTGNETIAGNKTFSSAIKINKGDSPTAGSLSHAFSMECKNSDGTKTHTIYPISFIGNGNTSNNYNSGVRLGSLNGTTVITSGESGSVFTSTLSKYDDENLYLESDNEIKIYVKCANNMSSFAGPVIVSGTATAGGTGSTTTITADNFTGNATTATKATQDEDGNAIKTTYAKDNAVVHNTGNETIDGQKTFTTTPKIVRVNPYLVFSETDIEKGVSNSTGYQGILFKDKNETELGSILYHLNENGNSYIQFQANAASTSDASGSAIIYLIKDANGNSIARAPSTLTTRTEGTDIVTRDYIDKAFSSTAIYTTTLAQTTAYTSSNPWNINIANIGNYKAIIAYIESTAATAAMNLYYKITFSDNKIKIVGVGSGINTAARYSTMYCENRYGYAYTHLQVSTSADAYSAWYTGAKPIFIDKYATISSIDVYSTTSNAQFPSGTKITIYGVSV